MIDLAVEPSRILTVLQLSKMVSKNSPITTGRLPCQIPPETLSTY